MAPRTYALDQRADPALPPVFIWSFDSPWLRNAALRENPGTLRAVMRAEVAHRVLRAHRRGHWRDVAPGVRVYLYDTPPLDSGFPAVPRLRFPNPRDPPSGGSGAAGGGRVGRAFIAPRWVHDAPRPAMVMHAMERGPAR